MSGVKTDNMFLLLEKLCNGEEIYPQNEELQEELNVSWRTLERYIKTITDIFSGAIVCEKKLIDGRQKKLTTYRFARKDSDTAKILKYLIENDDNNIGWVLTLIYENDMETIRKFAPSVKQAVSNSIARDKEVFLIKTNPFEDARYQFFPSLHTAVRLREYRTIVYEYDKVETLKNVKCLKLVFIDHNWYLACETVEERLRLLRLSFIKEVIYPESRFTYQAHILQKYQSYFDAMQNAMTLAGILPQKAILRANKNVRQYFKEGMKPFFQSQQFIKENDDGSIVFSVHFTQPLEILPFVKRWLPDIEILEPEKLKSAFADDLQKALSLI
ncbi:MAG: WYL domain-containing protein [Helicobacteraceae bacterium]|jgi:predicted DNA-binding transcriptional regulator YafY|nr:WYL domain-containing protein [Helicobacteraceae bacterium]